jgi:hypothetical protein
MTTPVSVLDQRYSGTGATAVGWEETRRILAAAELFWVSTVRADGRPHVTPVVAVWAGGAICFSAGAGEQKAVNLRTSPDVVLMTGCSRWDQGIDVVVEGRAVQVTDQDALRSIAGAFATKWDGRWQFRVHENGLQHPQGHVALVFSVRPAKVFAHARGDPFGATTHKF